MSNHQARIRFRAAIGIVIFGMGFSHSLYYISGLLGGRWENDAWNLLQVAAGIIFAGLGLWIYCWRFKEFHGRAKLLLRLVQAGIVLSLLFAGAVVGLIWREGQPSDPRETDYLIILGARVRGETISLSLKERLDQGAAYLERFPNTEVILSGGQGPGEDVTEAEAMKRYLMGKGVSAHHILLEDRSTSTYENMAFTRDLLLSKGFTVKDKTFTVITNDYHVYRSKWLARKVGFKIYGLPAPTPPITIPKSYAREFAAVIKTWVFGQ